MSGYILCQIPRTSVPYYIESISTNIYSIEELCYFFHQNLYLIDRSILNPTLYLWLKEQLGLKKLSQKLQNAEEKHLEGIREFVYPVFIFLLCLVFPSNFVKLLHKTPGFPQKIRAKIGRISPYRAVR